MQKSIFYDASNKRHSIIKRVFFFIAIVFASIVAISLVSLLSRPTLPAFNFGNFYHHSGFQETYEHVTTPIGRVLNPNTAYLVRSIAPVSSSAPDSIDFFSYYLDWNNGSFSSLKENIDAIDVLMPEWLSVGTTGLKIISDGEADRVTRFVRSNSNDTAIVPLISNFNYSTNRWDKDNLALLLSDTSQQKDFINDIVAYVDNFGFDGVTIGFHGLDLTTWIMLPSFMNQLRDSLKARNSKSVLYISCSLFDKTIPYTLIAHHADQLLINAYPTLLDASSPLPISSVPGLLLGLHNIAKKVDVAKLVIMLPTFGYDWSPALAHPNKISRQSAIDIMDSTIGVVNYDDVSMNPHFQYSTNNIDMHQVWYSDATTFFNHLSLGLRLGFNKFGLSDIGSEDSSLWTLLADAPTSFFSKPHNLEILRNGYDVFTVGSGLAFQLKTSIASTGYRVLEYDDSVGLITAQRITFFPQPDLLLRKPVGASKQVLLTFDDGPSSFTPQVLDILRQYSVPALFFIVGDNAWKFPNIMSRISREGHTIGHHTFVHDDTPLIDPTQLSLELHATQKIIQATTKHSSFLFRQPFAPNYHSDRLSLQTLENMGYYSLGSDMDAYDWDHPSTDVIVQRTINTAHSGNVVLLHDGGGDRSQTIAALPRIIEGLREQGYSFVDAPTALGLSKSDIMPPITYIGEFLSFFVGGLVYLFSTINRFLYVAFIVALLIGGFRLLLVTFFALYDNFKKNKTVFDNGFRPLVSVIVPAYNEGVVIVRTVENLLQSNYEPFEIIIVDDGSTDDTLAIARRHFSSYDRITILTQANGGKASALNFGISKSRGKIIVVQDADTIFDLSAISLLVRHFIDPSIGGVSGNVKVGNVCNLLGRCQSLEYMTSQAMDRRAFDVLNCINVVPGAIGAWRKKALEQVGGLTHHTLAEDGDLTLSILRTGRRIVYEKDAIAWTEAPDTIASFLKQRFRRLFGTLQVAWKHTNALGSFSNPWLGRFTIPYLYISSLLFPLIIPLLDLVGFTNLFLLLYYFFTGSSHLGDHGTYMLMFYSSMYLFLDGFVTLLACYLERQWSLSVAIIFPIQRFLYRFLMYGLGIKVIWTALTGRWVGRNKLERTGAISVNYEHIYSSYNSYVPNVSLVLFETLMEDNYLDNMRNRGMRMIRDSFKTELLSLKREITH